MCKELCPVFPKMNLFQHWSPLVLVNIKLSRKIKDGIVTSLVIGKDMPRNSSLCTRLPLHKAGMSLAAAQICI